MCFDGTVRWQRAAQIISVFGTLSQLVLAYSLSQKTVKSAKTSQNKLVHSSLVYQGPRALYYCTCSTACYNDSGSSMLTVFFGLSLPLLFGRA